MADKMAVTQQLARVFPSRLEKCRRDVTELDRLISFAMDPGEATIDLNWSAEGIKKGWLALGADETLSLLVETLGEGAKLLNKDYPTGPAAYSVYSEITAVDQFDVERLSEKLSRLSPVRREMITSRAAEIAVEDGVNGMSAREHYREELVRLQEFIEAAALSHQTIAAWWD